MNVTTIMAAILDEELQRLGVFSVGRGACEQIASRMIKKTASLGRELERGNFLPPISPDPAPTPPPAPRKY